MQRVTILVLIAAAVTGCASGQSSTPTAVPAPTAVTLTDAELAWCPDWIPAIYRAGLRNGAAPPADLRTVKAIEQELRAGSDRTDDMRFAIFTGMGYELQHALQEDWKRASPETYNRACKAAFASMAG